MQIFSDRRFEFSAEPDELWAALALMEDYQRWWPWLRRFDAEALAAGQRWACEVRPPLGYRIRFDIVLGEVVARRLIVADVVGDIMGSARLEIEPHQQGSRLRLVSGLAPASLLLRGLARLAPPVVRKSHDWVLDTGLGQFSADL